MGNFSGISVVLTLSLIALLSMEFIKDKFDVVENYGEENHKYNQEDTENPMEKLNLNTHPFPTGDFFEQPRIGPSNNGYNMTGQMYETFQNQLAAGTPNQDNLDLAGSHTANLPGPGNFVAASGDNSRMKNLSLCAQNSNTFGISTLGQPGGGGLASSLLPNNSSYNLEGFSDCDQNALTTQTFLTPSSQIGFDTTSSNRNANLDIRSLPPNPILNVSPWLNSTIYPDLTRRPLEGCDPSFGTYGTGAYSNGNPSPIGSGI